MAPHSAPVAPLNDERPRFMRASADQPAVTNEQLDELIAHDEAARGLWERSFELKYFALLELRARRGSATSDQLASAKRALTDSQLDYLIRIGQKNLKEDVDGTEYYEQVLGALKELRGLRRQCARRCRDQSKTLGPRQSRGRGPHLR